MPFFGHLRHQGIQEQPGFQVQRDDSVLELQAATVDGAWQAVWLAALIEYRERREHGSWADGHGSEIEDDVVPTNVWRPG